MMRSVIESLKGKFIVASPRLLDPNFVQAVVLVIQHDANGAMGVIINRPMEVSVRQACEPLEAVQCLVEAPLHVGGPCEGPLMALHSIADTAEGEVIPGVYFTVQRHHLESLLEAAPIPAKYVANYAGWGAGQLEAEIAEGSWLVLDAAAESIFEEDEQLWSKLIASATLGRWITPSQMPDDPSMN